MHLIFFTLDIRYHRFFPCPLTSYVNNIFCICCYTGHLHMDVGPVRAADLQRDVRVPVVGAGLWSQPRLQLHGLHSRLLRTEIGHESWKLAQGGLFSDILEQFRIIVLYRFISVYILPSLFRYRTIFQRLISRPWKTLNISFSNSKWYKSYSLSIHLVSFLLLTSLKFSHTLYTCPFSFTEMGLCHPASPTPRTHPGQMARLLAARRSRLRTTPQRRLARAPLLPAATSWRHTTSQCDEWEGGDIKGRCGRRFQDGADALSQWRSCGNGHLQWGAA